ncbi:cuticle protein 6-like protein [Leptotrombidium deliense]|uniref:Cuticle protein 6-like protein n=1 Tax=Leptotrombidium deliense TaxID=299467 RepID=A0A443SUW5_9ACAR|nr:cuticle protein 6-like protein [Leptotrombidium deliense]
MLQLQQRSGFRGPKSYKFGFQTGDECNPLSRHEARSRDGVVKGHYSYVDPKGVLRVVRYEAHPKYGFRVLLDAFKNNEKSEKTKSEEGNKITRKRH